MGSNVDQNFLSSSQTGQNSIAILLSTLTERLLLLIIKDMEKYHSISTDFPFKWILHTWYHCPWGICNYKKYCFKFLQIYHMLSFPFKSNTTNQTGSNGYTFVHLFIHLTTSYHIIPNNNAQQASTEHR